MSHSNISMRQTLKVLNAKISRQLLVLTATKYTPSEIEVYKQKVRHELRILHRNVDPYQLRYAKRCEEELVLVHTPAYIDGASLLCRAIVTDWRYEGNKKLVLLVDEGEDEVEVNDVFVSYSCLDVTIYPCLYQRFVVDPMVNVGRWKPNFLKDLAKKMAGKTLQVTIKDNKIDMSKIKLIEIDDEIGSPSYITKKPEVDVYKPCYINKVIDGPSKFVLQFNNELVLREVIQMKLDQLAKKDALTKFWPQIKDLVILKHENKFLRGIVSEKNVYGDFRVHCVDTGLNVAYPPNYEYWHVPESIMAYPILTHICSLSHYPQEQQISREHISSMFENIVMGREFLGKVDKTTEEKCEVSLFIDGISLLDVFPAPCYANLILHEKYKVVISYVAAGKGIVFVQEAKNQCLIADMHVELQTLTKIAPRNIEVGSLYLVLYMEDETWYRAILLAEEDPDGYFKVHYIDFGNDEMVKRESIMDLPPKWLSYGACAIPCALNGYTNTSLPPQAFPQEAVEGYVIEIEVNAEMNKSVRGRMEKVPVINFVCDQKKEQDPGKPIALVDIKLYEGTKHHCHVSCVSTSSCLFYATLVESDPVMKEIRMCLERVAEAEQVEGVEKGMSVCVFSNGKWQRASILDNTIDGVKVQLVDVGSYVRVLKSEVRLLPKELMRYPKQAVRCLPESGVRPSETLCSNNGIIAVEFLSCSTDTWLVRTFPDVACVSSSRTNRSVTSQEANLARDYCRVNQEEETGHISSINSVPKEGNEATFQKEGNEATFQKEGNEATFQKEGNEAMFQKEGNEATFQKEGNEATFQKEGNEAMFQKEGNETTFQKEGNEATFQKEGNEAMFQKEGNEATFQKEGNEATFQKEGNEATFQKEGNDATFQKEGNEATFQKVGNEATFQKEGKEATFQKEGNEATFQKEGKEATFQKEDNEATFQKEGNEAMFQKEGNEAMFQKEDNEAMFKILKPSDKETRSDSHEESFKNNKVEQQQMEGKDTSLHENLENIPVHDTCPPYIVTQLPLNETLDIKVTRVVTENSFVCKVAIAWTEAHQLIIDRAQEEYNKRCLENCETSLVKDGQQVMALDPSSGRWHRGKIHKSSLINHNYIVELVDEGTLLSTHTILKITRSLACLPTAAVTLTIPSCGNLFVAEDILFGATHCKLKKSGKNSGTYEAANLSINWKITPSLLTRNINEHQDLVNLESLIGNTSVDLDYLRKNIGSDERGSKDATHCPLDDASPPTLPPPLSPIQADLSSPILPTQATPQAAQAAPLSPIQAPSQGSSTERLREENKPLRPFFPTPGSSTERVREENELPSPLYRTPGTSTEEDDLLRLLSQTQDPRMIQILDSDLPKQRTLDDITCVLVKRICEDEMWLVRSGDLLALDILHNWITKTIQTLPVVKKPVVGGMYLTRSSQEHVWYRAVVKKITSCQPLTVQVFSIDYGMDEIKIIPSEELFMMPIEFESVSPLCYHLYFRRNNEFSLKSLIGDWKYMKLQLKSLNKNDSFTILYNGSDILEDAGILTLNSTALPQEGKCERDDLKSYPETQETGHNSLKSCTETQETGHNILKKSVCPEAEEKDRDNPKTLCLEDEHKGDKPKIYPEEEEHEEDKPKILCSEDEENKIYKLKICPKDGENEGDNLKICPKDGENEGDKLKICPKDKENDADKVKIFPKAEENNDKKPVKILKTSPEVEENEEKPVELNTTEESEESDDERPHILYSGIGLHLSRLRAMIDGDEKEVDKEDDRESMNEEERERVIMGSEEGIRESMIAEDRERVIIKSKEEEEQEKLYVESKQIKEKELCTEIERGLCTIIEEGSEDSESLYDFDLLDCYTAVLVCIQEYPFSLWMLKNDDVILANLLQETMDLIPEDELIPLWKPEVNQVCISEFGGNRKRAKIIALTPNEARLHFIDHGEYASVPITKLFSMESADPCFANEEPLAFQTFLPVKIIPGKENEAVLAVAEAAFTNICFCLDLCHVTTSLPVCMKTVVWVHQIGYLSELLIANNLAIPLPWVENVGVPLAYDIRCKMKEFADDISRETSNRSSSELLEQAAASFDN